MQHPHESAAPFTVIRKLGSGGNATVYEALGRGRSVALKRPREELLQRRPETRTLFEREYHTLVELAHPRIVEVYEYGVDEVGPYYAMELLDEGGLADRTPMAWPAACRVLRDVASALARVHSRRFVHRDVSLHNVGLNADGRAKLMDFGAMTPIGVPAETIGTPAYMAPEAFYRQSLDQRTDLYALGALGYRLLTGRDAYPARRIDQLRDAWRSRPVPLRQRIPDIPEALETLIARLLSLNPEGRYRSAAEVFVKLGAIAGIDDQDDAEIGRAYLAAPALIGRELVLSSIRQHIVQAFRRRGATVLIEAEPGMGRSRVLDACILEGQLAGALVLHTRALQGEASPFELVARLAEQLVCARPSFAPSSPRLLALLGRRVHEASGTECEPSELHATLQQELLAWLLQASVQPLLLVVDDLHLADLDSAAVIARLVDAAPQHGLLVVASAATSVPEVSAQALRVVRDRALCLTLDELSEEQTFSMVRSLFDDVVNVNLTAGRIYEIARGNPRATVDLAEWLVDCGHVVHEGGRWLIPDTISGLPLPCTVNEALRQRLSTLSLKAIELASALAVAGDAELLETDYAALLSEGDEESAAKALAELVTSRVVVPHGRAYGLTQLAYRDLLLELSAPERLAVIHRRIARLCLARKSVDWGIYHLFHGRAEQESTDLFLQRLSEGHLPTHILHSLEDRVGYVRALLESASHRGRRALDLFTLKNELVKCAEIKVSLARAEIAELTAQYKDLSGYTDWLALPESMAPSERLSTALARASERQRSLPEEQRLLEPLAVLPRMVEFVANCLGCATANCEIDLIEEMPQLAPFAPVSDAARLLFRYTQAIRATIQGHPQSANQRFLELLAELEGPVAQNLGPAVARLRRHALVALGMLNASLSRSTALDYADRLEVLAKETRDAYASSTTLRVRYQYHLRRGNYRQAQQWQQAIELDKLTDHNAVFNPAGTYALSWIHATTGNVAGMRDCLTQMREYSAVSPGLATWERYMAAEYDRLRGACELALPQYQEILDTQAGRHMAWLYAAHGVLLCYDALGRYEEGRRVGGELLERAKNLELALARGLIQRPLALLEARLGRFDLAHAYLAENIDYSIRCGMGGVNLGIVYEFRARVAILECDSAAFETYAKLCAEQYHAGGGSPDLSARYDALLGEARRAGVIASQWKLPSLAPVPLTRAQVELRDKLVDCPTPAERWALCLSTLVKSARAEGGLLFAVTDAGLHILANSGCGAVTPPLLEAASRYLSLCANAAAKTESVYETAESQPQTESSGTQTQSGRPPEWHSEETCEGLLPQIVFAPQAAAPVGLFLARAGQSPVRVPSAELLEVIGQSLLRGGAVP